MRHRSAFFGIHADPSGQLAIRDPSPDAEVDQPAQGIASGGHAQQRKLGPPLEQHGSQQRFGTERQQSGRNE